MLAGVRCSLLELGLAFLVAAQTVVLGHESPHFHRLLELATHRGPSGLVARNSGPFSRARTRAIQRDSSYHKPRRIEGFRINATGTPANHCSKESGDCPTGFSPP
jgi:hypothetical protein